MAPIQPGQKRYARLQQALKNAKITQSDFDYCVQNGLAYSTFKAGSPKPEEVPIPSPAVLAVPPKPEEIPLPSLTLVVPPQCPSPIRGMVDRQFHAAEISPKSPHYDVEAAEDKKFRAPRYEPFHGGVALMSLQEKFDSLADQVLSETEEGLHKEQVEVEVKKGWLSWLR